MSIIDKVKENIKAFIYSNWIDEAFWLVLIVFVAIASFSLGMRHQREMYLENNPIRIEEDKKVVEAWKEYIRTKKSTAKFFASKNGTVYYPLACSAGARINEENRVYFENEDDAKSSGYKQSKRCF
jgi:hypothetical protein